MNNVRILKVVDDAAAVCYYERRIKAQRSNQTHRQGGKKKKKKTSGAELCSSEATLALADWHQLLAHASPSSGSSISRITRWPLKPPALLTITPLTRPCLTLISEQNCFVFVLFFSLKT